jgi:hypothetical protein
VTITGFLDVYCARALPQLAFLRGGTMNTVANSVGVGKGRPEGILGRLLRDYAQRASAPMENVERHVMRIGPRDARAGERTHYGFLFGTGVVAGFLAEYYRGGEPTPLVAAKTLARGIGSAFIRGETIRRMAQPFRGSVMLDDGTAAGTRWDERDYLAVAAGTIPNIGLNFRPFHRYGELPGHFHMLGIHASPVAFVKELPRIHRAQPMRPGKTYEAVSSHAVVRSTDGVVRYMIDGDLHEARGDLDIGIGPRVKLVIVR